MGKRRRLFLTVCVVFISFCLSRQVFAYEVGDFIETNCSQCGQSTQHVINTLVPPTCVKNGTGKVTCSVCNFVHWISFLKSPDHHIWEIVSSIDSTCQKGGSIDYSCTVCGETKTEQLPVLEHIWEETSRTEATATSEGSITYTCSSCGAVRNESIPKLEPVQPEDCVHIWEVTKRTEATTTAPGMIEYTCSKCGEKKIEDIPALPPKPLDPGSISFMNWLGSVVSLFNMTLSSIIGFPALRLFVGVLVFLMMFGLLAKLLRQGRKGRL